MSNNIIIGKIPVKRAIQNSHGVVSAAISGESATPFRPILIPFSFMAGGLPPTAPSDLSISAQAGLRSIAAQYNIYAENHPLASYVQSLFARVSGGDRSVKVVVTKHWDSVNAIAISKDLIVLSDRLFSFCEYEEELLFVIAHEYNHLKQAQTKGETEGDSSPARMIDSMAASIGLARFNEYQSDLKSLPKMADQGVNPYGAKIFFERLARLDAQKDFEHGGPIDRVLNVGVITRLYDLKVLSQELTPSPAAVIRSLADRSGKSDFQWITAEPLDENDRHWRQEDRLEKAKTTDFTVLLEAFPVIVRRVEGTQAVVGGQFSLRDKILLERDQEILDVIVKRLWQHFERQLKNLPKQQRFFSFVLALTIDCGIDLLAVSDEHNPLYPVAEEFAELLDSPKAFTALAGTLDPELFKQLGLFAGRGLAEFLPRVFQLALEAGLFGEFDHQAYFDFCQGWIERAEQLGLAAGGRKIDRAHLFMEAVEIGQASVASSALAEYLAAAARQKIVLPDEWLIAQKEAAVGELAPEEILERIKNYSAQQIRETVIEETDKTGKGEETTDKLRQILLALLSGKGRTSLDAMTDIERLKYVLRLLADLPVSQDDKRLIGRAIINVTDQYKDFSFADLSDICQTILSWDSKEARYIDGYEDTWLFVLDNLCVIAKKSRKEEFILGYLKFMAELPEDIIVVEEPGVARKEFLLTVLTKYNYDLSSSEELRFLFEISFLFDDIALAVRFRNMLARRLLAVQDHDQSIEFLFNNRRTDYAISLAAKEDFIDHKVNSPTELQKVKKYVLATLDAPPLVALGKLAVLDVLSEKLTNKRNLFTTLMDTETGDAKIRELVLTAVLEDNNKGTTECAYGMRCADSMMQSLYQLDPLGVHAQVRILLVGEGGLLRSTKERLWLIEYFFKRYIQEDKKEEKLNTVLRQVLRQFIEEDDLETLFFVFASLIEKRILRPPEQPVKKIWKQALKMVQFDDYDQEQISAILAEYSKNDEEGDGGRLANYANYTESVLRLIGPEGPRNADDQKLSAIRLVVEIAEKMGSVGTRFLQLLGSYIEIPEDYKAEFSAVYDRMRGQTKLTGYLLLEREWLGFDLAISSLGEPIGGGSLMTTYRGRTADGKQKAIKVLNPNAEYHLEVTFGLMERLLAGLAGKHGGGYRLAGGLLGQIKEWIGQDIRFEDFVAKDAEFYRLNHGFQPEGFRYSVRVPKSEGPDNKYYKVEEFIEGDNLTQLETLAQAGHDLKQIVTLLVRNYWEQLQSGLVHSDVHPGNFRVTTNNEVAILDRNFFIELDEKDKALVNDLLLSFSDTKELVGALDKYLSFGPAIYEAAVKRVEEIRASGLDPFSQISEMILFLNQHGIKVPLKITLMVKNLNALQSMAKSAGFSGLFEAFTHTP